MRRATILVVEDGPLFARFKERLAPNRRHALEFANSVQDARRQHKRLQPWLLVVPATAEQSHLVPLLREARDRNTCVLALAEDGKPVPWADRVAPRDDLDQIAKAASALFVERSRGQPAGEQEKTPVFDMSEELGLDGVENTVVDTIAHRVLFGEEDRQEASGEITRRQDLLETEELAAQPEPELPERTHVDTHDAKTAVAPGLQQTLDGLKQQQGLLKQRVTALERRREKPPALQELREELIVRVDQANRVLAPELERLQDADSKLRSALDTQVALVAGLSQRVEEIVQDRAAAKEVVGLRRDLEAIRKEQERARKQAREGTERLRERVGQAGQELEQALKAQQQLVQQLRQLEEGAERLQGRAEKQAALSASLSQRLDLLVQDKASSEKLEETRRDLARVLEEVERKRDLAELQIVAQLEQALKTGKSQQERSDGIAARLGELEARTVQLGAAVEEKLSHLRQEAADGQQARVALQETIESQERMLGALDRRLGELARDKAASRELERARQELQQAQELLREQLQQARETQQQLVEQTREALQQQLDQAQQSRAGIEERVDEQAGRITTHERRLTDIVADKASVRELDRARAELEQTRQLLEQTREALEQADQALERELGAARQGLEERAEEQAARLGEQVARLDELAADRATVQDLEQARQDVLSGLEQAREEGRQADEALAREQGETRQALEARLEQAQQSRAELKGELEGQARMLEALDRHLAELGRDKASVQELQQSRDALGAALSGLERGLEQAQEAQSQRLEQARAELSRELEQAQRSRAELKGELEAHAKMLAALDRRLAELARDKAGVKELQQSREEAEQARAALTEADQALARQLAEARGALEEKLDRSRADLEQRLDQAQQARAALQGRIEGHEVKLVAQAGQLETLERERATVKDLDRTRGELGQARDALEQADRSIREELARHRGELDQADGMLEERLEQAREGLAGELERSVGELRAADGALSKTLGEARDALEKADGELDHRLDQLKSEAEQGRQRLEQQLEQTRSDLEAADQSLGCDLGEIRGALERTEKALSSELERSRDALEGADRALGNEIGQARAALEASDQALEQRLEQTQAELEQQVRQLREDADLQLGQAHDARGELQGRLDEQAAALSSQEQQSRDVAAELRQRLDEQGTALAALSEAVQQLQTRDPVRALVEVLRRPLVFIPLLCLLAGGIGAAIYVAVRSGDEPSSGPPVAVVAPDARVAAAPRPPDAAPPAPDLAPVRPDLALPADVGLPAHVVEPAPGDLLRAKGLSPARRRALRRERAQRVRGAQRMLRRGKPGAAIALLTRALQLADGPRVRQLLSLAHERARQLEAAAYHLERAIDKAPARQQGALRQRLEQLRARTGRGGGSR